MAVQEVILKTNPAGPVEYSEKAIKKALEASYLIADTKVDGVQLNLVVERVFGTAHADFLSRAGKYLPALQRAWELQFVDANLGKLLEDDTCIYPNGFMLQAEIVTPGQPAEVTAGNLRRKSVPLDLSSIEVQVFGVVPLDVVESGKDHDVTHAIMKYHVEAMTALLQKHVPQIAWKVIETVDVFTYEELQRVYGVRREEGQEGLVLKDPLAIWKRGKKVGQWKMKPEDTIDGTVQGLIWGTPGLGNEGKVIGFEVLLEDGHVVNACGLTQAQKDEFTGKVHTCCLSMEQSEREALRNPFDGWAVEVSFMERFKDGSLRHPSFSRWRGISDPKVKE
ncbi:ATP-dependent DNA ligase [Metapseudomonas otitidis]|uniref:ATP-dependent DNA ligase n=1 Tax=Metapseudomonas otitidis TaxID=319939 RepID=UPI0013F68AA1|nr:ATP-dependent DNA ligase [Pseudomonas otitidis]